MRASSRGPAGSTSGVGRRSALSLVCHMHGLELVTPATTRDYGIRSFRAELKAILPKVGIQGQPTVLLLEDHQLRDEQLIECVNSLLSAGELPGLYEPQELEPLLAPLKEEMGKSGFTHRSLYDFFVHRVQQFLHIALIMDPSNPSFLMRCESNPALYTRCTMLWMARHVSPHLTPRIPHIPTGARCCGWGSSAQTRWRCCRARCSTASTTSSSRSRRRRCWAEAVT